MIDKFRAWNTIVNRYQYFELKDIETQKGSIQWDILKFEQSTGKIDANNKEIYEGDFYRVEEETDDGDNIEFYIITWIKEWSLFGTLSTAEYLNYLDNGVGVLDESMFWTYLIHEKEGIKIIGNLKQNIDKINKFLSFELMKFFLDGDTFILYAVEEKYHFCIDIINKPCVDNEDEDRVNEALKIIIDNCTAVLRVDAVTQSL